MAIKLEAKNLYKVFGGSSKRHVFELIEAGLTKEKILKKNGLFHRRKKR